eukprot:4752009-Pyramimonas_sp.AAC.1
MFGISDSESEPEPSMRPEDMEDASNEHRPLPNPHSAVAANVSDRRTEFETIPLCSETCRTHAGSWRLPRRAQ